MEKILFIEDKPEIRKEIKAILQNAEFEVKISSSGKVGYELAKGNGFELIIIDIDTKDKSGIEFCNELRSHKIITPIIILTGNKERNKIIGAFNYGADDYVVYPFLSEEFIARINAIIRRSKVYSRNYKKASIEGVKIDFKKHIASSRNKKVKFTSTEYKILQHFIEHEGEVVSRADLIDNLWGVNSSTTTRTIDNYILSIRKKIEKDRSNPKHILTIPTIGYKFVH